MPNKFPVERAGELLSPAGPGTLDPNHVIATLPLRPFQVIADIGCGPGYLAIPLAKYAYDGRVYAIDIQQGMLDLADEQARKHNLGNLNTVLSKETKIPLEKASVDGALLAGVLHESTSPTRLLKDVCRIVKPQGWIAIIEWHKAETEGGPPVEERLAMKDAVKLLEKQSLAVSVQRRLTDSRYIVMATR